MSPGGLEGQPLRGGWCSGCTPGWLNAEQVPGLAAEGSFPLNGPGMWGQDALLWYPNLSINPYFVSWRRR